MGCVDVEFIPTSAESGTVDQEDVKMGRASSHYAVTKRGQHRHLITDHQLGPGKLY